MLHREGIGIPLNVDHPNACTPNASSRRQAGICAATRLADPTARRPRPFMVL